LQAEGFKDINGGIAGLEPSDFIFERFDFLDNFLRNRDRPDGRFGGSW
jgi:hypothetical protein